MTDHADSGASDAYRRQLSRDPASFLDHAIDVVFSLPPEELDEIRLDLARQKVTAALNGIQMVQQLATRNQVSAITSFDDLIPLLYSQDTFKSYPQSWLEAADFPRMTRWLGKLCAADLRAVDASSCELIEDWIKALARGSPVDLLISAGADGKAAFLPRTRREWGLMHRFTLWNFQSSMTGPHGESLALRPGVDRVPLIHPGPRSGARSWGRFMDFYEETFGTGLVDAPLGNTDADLLSLAGRVREASRKGEAGSLQINPRLLARKTEIAQLNAEKPRRLEALMERLTHEYRGRRIIFYSSMQMLHDLAMRLRGLGIQGAYAPDSFFFCGGGFADGRQPPHWKEEVAEVLGVSENAISVGYGMQEGLWAMALCRHGKYHVPPTLIPYVLDEENDRPLPRIGRQTGRFAFFDLLPETSWGGYITSDHVTITWDSPCPCGRRGAHLDAAISKVVSRQDDKIGCAGTAGALDDATEFLLKA